MQAIPVEEATTPSSILEAAAERFGSRECYVEPAAHGERVAITFDELCSQVARVGGLFEAHGVLPGQVVAICLPASIDFAIACLGAHWIGAIASGINPRLGERERTSILERLDPAVIIVGDDVGRQEHDRMIHAHEVRSATNAPVVRVSRAASDPAAIVWTSGTTGSPKGAVFTNRCLAAVAGGADDLGAPGDIRLSPLPFAHVGYMTRITDELAKGITTVISPTPWRASDTLSLLETEHVTVAQGVPTQWALIAREPDFFTRDLSSLRVAGTGAAPMEASLIRQLRDRLEVPVIVRYTSTESSLGAGTRPEDPVELVATTVGRAVGGATIEVRHDDGTRCAPGVVGRIWILTPAAMIGYLDRIERSETGASVHIDDELTANVRTSNGWIKTGDFASADDDGNLQLFGRDNDLYLRGGYNVYPLEVEHILASAPGVRDVCVLGTSDPVLGEVGVAVVVPHDLTAPPTLADLRGHGSGLLADYKLPDALVLVDALPVTAMMKVDRVALREVAANAGASRRRG